MPKYLEQKRGESIRGIVLSRMIPPLFLERWTGFDVTCMGRGRGDRNLGTKEACPDYSKGGEAGWNFRYCDVASVIFYSV